MICKDIITINFYYESQDKTYEYKLFLFESKALEESV